MKNKRDNIVVVNVKLDRGVRDKLKKITSDSSITMQDLISAFIQSYINNPEAFNVKTTIEQSTIPDLKLQVVSEDVVNALEQVESEVVPEAITDHKSEDGADQEISEISILSQFVNM